MAKRPDQFEALDGPHERGQASEAIVKAEFLSEGIPVLTPEYDNEPYDIVVEYDGSFHRVQVKTAYENKAGTVQFETISTRARTDGYERDGYGGLADLFAVFNPMLNEIYVVPVKDAAKGKMEIRYREPANGQTKGINWHEDFSLQSWIASQ